MRTLSSGSHVVRLLEFIPGKIFHEVPQNFELFYELGKFAAEMNVVMKVPRNNQIKSNTPKFIYLSRQNFHHSAYDTYKTLWTLDAAPQIRAFYAALSDEKKKLVESVLSAFEKRVLNIRHKLTPGMIHGDINEQNVVVKQKDDGSWCLEAILDFGDSQFSCLLYEIAIAMTYAIILSKDASVGGHVLAGYLSRMDLPKEEVALLKVNETVAFF